MPSSRDHFSTELSGLAWPGFKIGVRLEFNNIILFGNSHSIWCLFLCKFCSFPTLGHHSKCILLIYSHFVIDPWTGPDVSLTREESNGGRGVFFIAAAPLRTCRTAKQKLLSAAAAHAFAAFCLGGPQLAWMVGWETGKHDETCLVHHMFLPSGLSARPSDQESVSCLLWLILQGRFHRRLVWLPLLLTGWLLSGLLSSCE